MYMNADVPSVQTEAGFVYFVKTQLGARLPSTVMIPPMTGRFVTAIERFTTQVDLVTFERGQRKHDVAQANLAAFTEEACSPSAKRKRRRASSTPRRPYQQTRLSIGDNHLGSAEKAAP
jgi:hypothetical protein